jgi:hypothetical protein
MIDARKIREIFDYDAQRGFLVWRARSAEDFYGKHPHRTCASWNNKNAGKPAGWVDKFGYVWVRIGVDKVLAHRVVWAFVYGEWPCGALDHKNCIKSDNRAENLRIASPAQNAANRRRQSNNTSGVKGVFWNPRSSKWMVRIKKDGVLMHIGVFDSLDDAALAYEQAAIKVHGEFARVA